MTPGAMGFLSATAQQGTMFGGHDPSLMGGVIPGMGPFSALLQPVMSGMMAQVGMYPGMFNPTANVYDIMRADAMRQQQMQMQAVAAQQVDTSTWLKMTGGAVRAMGLPWGLDQQAAFRQSYGMAAPYLSMLAQVAPQTIDAMHGSKGSAAVMMSGLTRGGQYGMDALTGMSGLSADTMTSLARTIDSRLYGSPEAISQMRGIGMGSLGQLYDEGLRRGYMPGSLGARSRESQLRAISGDTGESIQAIRGLDDQAFGEKLRQTDMNRTASRLKDLAGAVSAMRDLFGANGMADAPMSQLINGLEAITQSRLGSMSPAQVSTLVRKTKSVLDVTGVSLDGLMSMTARAGAYGDQLGLDRSFATTAGQNAVMMGAGYRNSFGSSYSAFGAMNLDEVQQRELLFQQRAAGSEQAQFAGAFIRSASAMGVGEDTRAGRLAAALKSGARTFEGQSMYRILSRGSLSEIMSQSGGGAAGVAALNSAMSDPFGNQEFVSKYKLGSLARSLQVEELADRMGRPSGESAILQALTASGMSQGQAAGLARARGGGLLEALMNSEDVEGLSTVEGRRRIMGSALEGTAAAKHLGAISVTFESLMNKQAKHYGFGDIGKMLQTHNRTVTAQAARIDQRADIEAAISESLSPLGRGGVVQRVADMLQNNGDLSNEDIGKTLGAALGGIDVDDIRKLTSQQALLRTLGSKPNPTAADIKMMEQIRGTIGGLVKGISKVGEATGADIGRTIDSDTLKQVTEGFADVGRAGADGGRRRGALGTAMTRTHNMVQSLYLDDKTLRRMGAGGFDAARKMEERQLQILRLTGGDMTMLDKALRDDKSVPEDVRRQLKAAYADMSAQGQTLSQLEKAGKGFTDAEWAKEHGRIKEFRESREAADGVQTDGMVDRLAKIGGLKDVSREERAKIAGMLGGFGEARRKDLMNALSKREQLQKMAEEKGITVDELIKQGGEASSLADEAGTLSQFAAGGAGGDVTSLSDALDRFATSPDEARAAANRTLTIRGRLKIDKDGEGGSLEGEGNQGGDDPPSA